VQRTQWAIRTRHSLLGVKVKHPAEQGRRTEIPLASGSGTRVEHATRVQFQRPAGNTPQRVRRHAGLPDWSVFKFEHHSRSRAHRVSAAGRRGRHASRVLHPEPSARRHRKFDAPALTRGSALACHVLPLVPACGLVDTS
jgi:hypothetical protein